MDIQKLKENLAYLDATVPTVPDKVAVVRAAAEGYGAAVEGTLEDVKGLEDQAREVLEDVQNAMEKVRERAGEEKDRLDEAMVHVEDALRTALGALEEGGDSLTDGVDGVTAALGALNEDLDGGASRAETATDEARAKIEGLQEEAVESGEALRNAVGAVTDALESVDEELTSAESELSQAVSDLVARIQSLAGDAATRLEETRQRLGDAHDALVSDIGTQTDALGAGADAQLGLFRAAIAQDVRDRVAAAAQEAVAEMGRLSEALHEAARLASDEVDEAAQGVDRVRERMGPLEMGVESVQAAARQVGLPWE
jgi:chromosome segregation ATPase